MVINWKLGLLQVNNISLLALAQQVINVSHQFDHNNFIMN